MPTVKNLLDQKGGQVWAVSPETSVLEATHEMNRRKVGALLVVKDGHVLGIFTERDILTRVVANEHAPSDIRVCDVMTSPVAYCTPDTTMESCKAIFTEKRIRHMPVMEGNKPVGIVATGDIMAYEAADLQATVKYLEAYICEAEPGH